VKLIGEPHLQMLLEVIEPGCLQEHYHAATEATPHHPRPDHLRHPTSQVDKGIQLRAADGEIALQAGMRGIEERPVVLPVHVCARAGRRRIGTLPPDLATFADNSPSS